MGGTIIRLVEQGHKVHIAYMTSGNIAVFDHDAWRFTDFVCSFNELFDINKEKSDELKERRARLPAQEEAGRAGLPGIAGDQEADPRDRGAGRRLGRRRDRPSS